jgi:hypothetical protein
VLRHKFYVYQEGRKLGLGRWQLLIHDLSKFSRAEWGPYVRKFYGGPSPRDTSGGYDPNAQGDEFKRAWAHHWQTNLHHWEHWSECLPAPLPMPDRYRREMLADWRGAGLAQGKPDTAAFYRANGTRMRLHPETRAWVEAMLGIEIEHE